MKPRNPRQAGGKAVLREFCIAAASIFDSRPDKRPLHGPDHIANFGSSTITVGSGKQLAPWKQKGRVMADPALGISEFCEGFLIVVAKSSFRRLLF
jgi:hypothetical protein